MYKEKYQKCKTLDSLMSQARMDTFCAELFGAIERIELIEKAFNEVVDQHPEWVQEYFKESDTDG